MMNTRLILVIGPTAVGKSSLIERALRDHPELVDLITFTTRSKRSGESDGNPYHFVTQERFLELERQGFFLETANVHGRLYGTPKDQVQAATAAGRAVIADVDVQGAKKLLGIFPQALTIFLMPPALETLRERFERRGITGASDLAVRLENARREIAEAKSFQHIVINDDFERAYAEFRKWIQPLLAKS